MSTMSLKRLQQATMKPRGLLTLYSRCLWDIAAWQRFDSVFWIIAMKYTLTVPLMSALLLWHLSPECSADRQGCYEQKQCRCCRTVCFLLCVMCHQRGCCLHWSCAERDTTSSSVPEPRWGSSAAVLIFQQQNRWDGIESFGCISRKIKLGKSCWMLSIAKKVQSHVL